MELVRPDTVTAIATPIDLAPMTRNDKLERWAQLVERHDRLLMLMHRLEFRPPDELRVMLVYRSDIGDGLNQMLTPMWVAAADPVLQDAGLRTEAPGNPVSILQCMHFFEISQTQLHTFSCDCGGSISKERMAAEIRSLKD